MSLRSGLIEALQPAPGEHCGFLLGREETVIDFLAGSTSPAGEGFVLTPADLLRAELVARQRHLQVIGVYHSHPSGNLGPSWKDHFRAVRGWLYLIVNDHHKFKIYRRDQQRFLAQACLDYKGPSDLTIFDWLEVA